MKEFTLLFRLSSQSDKKPSLAQLQERMAWLAGLAAQNKLVNKGNTLSVTEAKTVHADHVVTDGPYTEIKEFVSGYLIVRAETIEEAVELAKTNPIFKVGGSIEIREVVQLYEQKS